VLPKSFIALIKNSDRRKPEVLLFTDHGSDGRSFNTIRGSKLEEERNSRERERGIERRRERDIVTLDRTVFEVSWQYLITIFLLHPVQQ
jgi:hypothetical protein